MIFSVELRPEKDGRPRDTDSEKRAPARHSRIVPQSSKEERSPG